MSKKAQSKHAGRAYEIGYGKPPVAGQFAKGRSGNPIGRPKKKTQRKPPAEAGSSAATRDLFLKFAARMVSGRGGDGDMKITAEEAVLHSLLSAAAKGSSHAQKYFLERLERHRAEQAAEIAEEHEYWRNYAQTYSKAVESMRKSGQAVPDDWPHPEDFVFKEGQHVMLRGGADALEVKRNQERVLGLRDAFMLQSVKDERSVGASLAEGLFLSHVAAHLANMALPKRMRLEETQYLFRHLKNSSLRTSELKRRLRDAWTTLGHSEWADIVTQPLRHDALKRLHAYVKNMNSAWSIRPDLSHRRDTTR